MVTDKRPLPTTANSTLRLCASSSDRFGFRVRCANQLERHLARLRVGDPEVVLDVLLERGRGTGTCDVLDLVRAGELDGCRVVVVQFGLGRVHFRCAVTHLGHHDVVERAAPTLAALLTNPPQQQAVAELREGLTRLLGQRRRGDRSCGC